MTKSLKRNNRKKAAVGAAIITGVASLIGAGISAYSNYRNAKRQMAQIKEQNDLADMSALSDYYNQTMDRNEQLQRNANMIAKKGIRRSLKSNYADSSTGVSRKLVDSNGSPTNLFFSDKTDFNTMIDANGDVITIPNAKDHDDPTKGQHGNIDSKKNGKQKAVVQVEKHEPVRVKNNELEVVSDSIPNPFNPTETLASSVINGNLTFEDAMNINEKYMSNNKKAKDGTRKSLKQTYLGKVNELPEVVVTAKKPNIFDNIGAAPIYENKAIKYLYDKDKEDREILEDYIKSQKFNVVPYISTRPTLRCGGRKKAARGWSDTIRSDGNVTYGDLYTGIGSLLGDLAIGGLTAYGYSKMKAPKPRLITPVVGLNTRYNNNPELAAIEENRVRNNDYIKRNVNTGAGADELIRRNNNDALQSTIASIANGKKIEIGLQNEDIKFQNEQNRENAAIISQSNAEINAFENERRAGIMSGINSGINGIKNSLVNFATNIENRKTNKMNAAAAMMTGNSASRREFALRHPHVFDSIMGRGAADRELEGYITNPLNSNAKTITEEYNIQDSDMRRWKTMPQNQLEKELKSRGYSDETIASIYDELQYFPAKFGTRKSLKRI